MFCLLNATYILFMHLESHIQQTISSFTSQSNDVTSIVNCETGTLRAVYL